LFRDLKIKIKYGVSKNVYLLVGGDAVLEDGEKDVLASKVQALLFPGGSELVMDSIRYFVELPSVSALLHDWLHDESAVYNLLSPKYTTPQPIWRDFILSLYIVSRSLLYLHNVTTYTSNSDLMLSTGCAAMRAFGMNLHEGLLQNMDEYTSLCSFCLKYALQTKSWQAGFQACCCHPYNPTKNIPLLVVTMVQHGAIRDFLLLSKDLLQNSKHGRQYYDVVGYALYEAFTKEQDHTKGIIYLEALYMLHVYHEHWKKASQIMNIIYNLQLLEYSRVKKSLNTSCDDVYLAAMACYHNICLGKNEHQKYLISDKTLDDVKLTSKFDDGSSDSYLQFPIDLKIRMMIALGLVYYEKDMKDKIGTLFKYDGEDQVVFDNIKSVVGVLGEKGCFALAVSLAHVGADKIKTNGVHGALLQEIFCEYLVPLAVVLSRPTPVNASDANKEYERDLYDKAPDLSTLSAQLGASLDGNPFVQPDEWRPSSESRMAKLKGLVCTKLLQNYLKTAAPSVVVDVADKMLVLDDCRSSLPTWLLQLFTQQNGLFASFPSPNTLTSPGNPSDLLRLYIRHGMFIAACNLVTSILSQPKKLTPLPEKGDVEYVPYNDIDKLWKMTSYILKVYLEDDKAQRKELTNAREEMKIALIGHYTYLKECDAGRKSARILWRK